MKVLAVHPHYELYGSDRAFASAVRAMRERLPDWDITVVLPKDGPLLTLPIFRQVRVIFESMWVPRRPDLKPLRLPGFLARGLGHLWQARRRMAAHDLVYVDTIACLDYNVMTRWAPAPVAIHVHEIPLGAELRVFRRMMRWSRAAMIFNSEATRDAFALPASVRQFVVYNGVAGPAEPVARGLRGDRPLRVLVIGRISFWKGQEVLVEALGLLNRDQRASIELRIVGSVFGDQTAILDALKAQVATLELDDRVTFHPFVDDPDAHYRWADVVVVPSTRPEPFGRVAIEGMAYGCAVIASAHGGLVESVEDGLTGRLVPPSDPAALAAALAGYEGDQTLVLRHGGAGRARFLDRFTDDAADRSFAAAMRQVATRVPAGKR